MPYIEELDYSESEATIQQAYNPRITDFSLSKQRNWQQFCLLIQKFFIRNLIK